jgi:type II secretory pathway pseudopilin PulG
MRLRSPEYRGCGENTSTLVAFMLAAVLLPAIALGLGSGPAFAAAEDAATDVAYVAEVSGRVVASSHGKPTLLDALDIISDRTRLDLQANSELRICHYRSQQLLSLKGPLRASISRDGVTVESSNAVAASAGPCAAPVVSTFQGGIVSRGLKPLAVPLQPNIKIVNRGTDPIRKITLWDGENQRILMTFDRNGARPTLDEGQTYLLVVERSDGRELKMVLQGSAVTRTDPLIVMVR